MKQTVWSANKPLRLLFWAAFASSVGDWCRHVAVVGLAVSCSGAGLKIAVLLLLEVLPLLFVGPLAGAVIDRISPKKVMVACDLSRAVLTLGFLFVHSGEQLWIAYLLTALISIFDAPSMAARQTLISRLVPPDSLVSAHALFSLNAGLCIAIGSVAATALAAAWGNTQIFLFDATTFALSCLFLLLIQEGGERKAQDQEDSPVRNYLQDIREGFIYIRHDAKAASLLTFNMLRSAGSGIVYFLLSVFGYTVFEAGLEGVGLFHVCFGAGFFLGAIFAKELAAKIGWRHYSLLMGTAAMAEGIFVALFSRTETFLTALLILGTAYIARSVAITVFNSLSSRLVEEQFRGRYFALNTVLSYAAMGVTMLLCGYGLNLFSAQQLALFAGVFLFANGALWMISGQTIAKAFIEVKES